MDKLMSAAGASNVNKKTGTIELLPHNQMLYDKIVAEIEMGEHSIFYSEATGLGKSFIFMRLVQDYFYNKRVLYICPKIAIWENLVSYKEFSSLNARIDMMSNAAFNIYDTSLSGQYDAVFVDECHHMLSDIQGANIHRLCKDMKQLNKYAFGFTATPYYQGQYVDEILFDCSCYGYDIFEAVELGLLPKVKLALADIDMDSVPYQLKVKYSIQGTKNLLEKLIADHKDIRKWLAYFSDSKELEERAYELKCLFPEYKLLKAYIGCDVEDSIVFNEFNTTNEKVILLSVNKLLEGVHLKGVGGVLLYRNVTELSTYMQIYGRLCSINSKTTPVFLDVTNAIVGINKVSEFKSSRYLGSRRSFDIKELCDVDASDYWTIELSDLLKKYRFDSWTEYEDSVIIDNYRKISMYDLCVLLPDRSVSAIRARASILGVTANKPWSDSENEILYNNMDKTARELEELLPSRTWQSIKRQRIRLGIQQTAPVKWTDEEINTLKECSGMYIKDIAKLIPNRTESAILNMCKNLHLPRITVEQDEWTEDEINILIDNYPQKGSSCFSMLPHRTASMCANKVFRLGLEVLKKDGTKKERSTKVTTLSEEMLQHVNSFIENNPTLSALSVRRSLDIPISLKYIQDRKRELGHYVVEEYSEESIKEFKNAYTAGGYKAVLAIEEFKDLKVHQIRRLAEKHNVNSNNRRLRIDDNFYEVIDRYLYTDKIILPSYEKLTRIFTDISVGALSSRVLRRAMQLNLKSTYPGFTCCICNEEASKCTCTTKKNGFTLDELRDMGIGPDIDYRGFSCNSYAELSRLLGKDSFYVTSKLSSGFSTVEDIIDYCVENTIQ